MLDKETGVLSSLYILFSAHLRNNYITPNDRTTSE
jgi:hypothetical protein